MCCYYSINWKRVIVLTDHRKVAENFENCIEANVLRDMWCSWFKCLAQVFRKVAVDNALHHIIRYQERIKVTEGISHIGPQTKVIPFKLFLEMVHSSSEDVTRVLRGCFR